MTLIQSKINELESQIRLLREAGRILDGTRPAELAAAPVTVQDDSLKGNLRAWAAKHDGEVAVAKFLSGHAGIWSASAVRSALWRDAFEHVGPGVWKLFPITGKPQHWTQLPENRAKVRRTVNKMRKTKKMLKIKKKMLQAKH